MSNKNEIIGNQNVVIQGVVDSVLTVNVNGNVQEIQNDIAELKTLIEQLGVSSFKVGETSYALEDVTQGNFGYIQHILQERALNEELTMRLMEAISPYNTNAKRFMTKAPKRNKDWIKDDRFADRAKDMIAQSYVGVLGIQLRKLIAIGKEANFGISQQQQYIKNCKVTAKRTMQLLVVSLISELWNFAKKTPLDLEPDLEDKLELFFDDEIEMSLLEYLKLLELLQEAYIDDEIKFPITELSTFQPNFKKDSPFFESISKLESITAFTTLNCLEVEHHLTTVLVELGFLANYKMVSVRGISYEEMRNAPPQYLHDLTELGIDRKTKTLYSNQKRLEDNPVSTDAILMYAGDDYQHGFNLFPFIIDVNALTFEQGAKICFYSFRYFEEDRLTYCFMEDNKEVYIEFKNTRNADDINTLIMDDEKRKALKLDMVFEQFEEAKKTILQ